MKDFNIVPNHISKVSVFGYYEKDRRVYFTCLNQGVSTPQYAFELDFDLDIVSGYSLIKNPNQSRVFVPITNND